MNENFSSFAYFLSIAILRRSRRVSLLSLSITPTSTGLSARTNTKAETTEHRRQSSPPLWLLQLLQLFQLLRPLPLRKAPKLRRSRRTLVTITRGLVSGFCTPRELHRLPLQLQLRGALRRTLSCSLRIHRAARARFRSRAIANSSPPSLLEYDNSLVLDTVHLLLCSKLLHTC